jgi:hypothetical protein
VLQEPEEQPAQELLGLEAEVNLNPTLAAQALINFSTLVWPQWGHATSGLAPKTSFSKSWLQLWQWYSKMGIAANLLADFLGFEGRAAAPQARRLWCQSPALVLY